MLSIKLSEAGDFDSLGERWQSLQARAAPSFFQSWTWVGCLAEDRFPDPVLLEASEAGETVALALFTAFPLFKDYSDALQDFLATNLMPAAVSDNVMQYLNEFARQASKLTAIGSVFLMITALLLIMSIDSALNNIWHVGRQRPISQRILVYWAVVSLGPVMLGASLWTSTYLARESLGLVTQIPILDELGISVVPFALTGLGFSAIFVVVPNCKVLWRDAFAGGALTAVVLEAMKIGFAFYISRFPTYTIIYGTFAAVPAFLAWIYISWIGVLLGATLAARVSATFLNRCAKGSSRSASFR